MCGNRWTEDSGMAYVVILFVIVIMTTLGLSFALKAGTEAATTMHNGSDMQAQYLAESAAHHALWRLLNDSSFNPNNNQYYMHSLAGGRYGYKVRKHTATTFATIATVGAIGDSMVQQSYVVYIKPGTLSTWFAYDTDAGPDTMPPHYRKYDIPSAAWGAETDAVTLANYRVNWLRLAGNPTKQELVMGTVSEDGNLCFQTWNGTAWGSLLTAVTGYSSAFPYFDIAYEHSTGRCVALFGTNGSGMYSRVWDGSAWSAAAAIATPPTKGQVVVSKSHPSTNEILSAVLDVNNDVYVFRWNGSAYTNLSTVETNTPTATNSPLEVAYEQQSGGALVIWSRSASTTCKYRTWNGSVLGSEGSLPACSSNALWLRSASDPTSDQVMVAALDSNKALYVMLWDGSTWSSSRQVATGLPYSDRRCFDIAWDTSGNHVMVTYSTSSGVYYWKWTKGTALSTGSPATGLNLSTTAHLIRLLADPNSDNFHIFTAVMLNSGAWPTYSARWNSTTSAFENLTNFTDYTAGNDLNIMPLDAATTK